MQIQNVVIEKTPVTAILHCYELVSVDLQLGDFKVEFVPLIRSWVTPNARRSCLGV